MGEGCMVRVAVFLLMGVVSKDNLARIQRPTMRLVVSARRTTSTRIFSALIGVKGHHPNGK